MFIIYIILGLIALAWVTLNLFVGLSRTPKQMRHAFIEGQNICGIIFSNLFFALAWFVQLCKELWRLRDQHGFNEYEC